MAECSTCGLLFASDDSFDRHRIGRFSDDERYDTRRCLSIEEMVKGLPVSENWQGGKKTPWHQNQRGHWTHRLAPEDRPGGLPIAPRTEQGPEVATDTAEPVRGQLVGSNGGVL